jgi:diguanylate cyclase
MKHGAGLAASLRCGARPCGNKGKAVVVAVVETDPWRQKYFAALKAIEADEQRWKATEDSLRRLAAKLCIGLRGANAQLDVQLDAVTTALRQVDGAAAIDGLLAPLSKAIGALDQAPARPADDLPHPKIEALLVRLLDHLAAFPELQARVGALRAPFDGGVGNERLASRLHAAADLVQEMLVRMQREKSDIEGLVVQFTAQLDAIAGYLQDDARERQGAREESGSLDQKVMVEVGVLGRHIEKNPNLDALRSQVRASLAAIDGHVHAFRDREKARTASWRERATLMHTRLAHLEKETRALQESLRREQHAALTDALTGIANRLAYDERMAGDFRRWKRHRLPMTLAAWDIDHFKAINDRYGHSAGDKVLQIIARHLAGSVRATDFVARYGGEEFVMILDGAPLHEAVRMADKWRAGIAALGFHGSGVPVVISLSCGLTEIAEGDTPERAFERADKLLYEAKQAGRNCCIAR